MNECEEFFNDFSKPIINRENRQESSDDEVVVEKDSGIDFLLEANLEYSPAKEDLQSQNDDDFN